MNINYKLEWCTTFFICGIAYKFIIARNKLNKRFFFISYANAAVINVELELTPTTCLDEIKTFVYNHIEFTDNGASQIDNIWHGVKHGIMAHKSILNGTRCEEPFSDDGLISWHDDCDEYETSWGNDAFPARVKLIPVKDNKVERILSYTLRIEFNWEETKIPIKITHITPSTTPAMLSADIQHVLNRYKTTPGWYFKDAIEKTYLLLGHVYQSFYLAYLKLQDNDVYVESSWLFEN